MKKYYQYFGLALITIFSFYYTEQISSIVLNKNPLMMTIKEKANDYNIKSVNAEIVGNTIIPGINGLEVSARESFYQMQKEDVFNEYYLIFEQIKPKISLENNKDKIITKGNRKLKKVSFIIDADNKILDYFKTNELKASILVNLDTYKQNSTYEVINNEVNGFKSLENNLNLNKENKHICVINNENKDLCLKQKNYLVNPILKLSSNNLTEIKSNIENGSIIYLTKKANLSDVKLIIKEVKYKGLEIVNLSEIISEENKNVSS